jgi:hypothetical protein
MAKNYEHLFSGRSVIRYRLARLLTSVNVAYRGTGRYLQLLGGFLVVAVPALAGQPVPAGIHHDGVLISHETTRILKPLGSNGDPDYSRALNDRLSDGVRPADNAAVPLMQAWGPQESCRGVPKKDRSDYFRMLGIGPLAERGKYLVDFRDFVKSRVNDKGQSDASSGWQKSALDQYDAASLRPWSGQEFPLLARWLTANETPLALVIEASRRRRAFEPIVLRENLEQQVGVPSSLTCAPYCNWIPYRESAGVLKIRAMKRLHEGRIIDAWEDLLASHRLARLAGQSPAAVDSLKADVIEMGSLYDDRTLLHYVKLSAAQRARILGDLSQLSSMPNIADKCDLGERYECLSWALRSMHDGLGSLKETLAYEADFAADEIQRAAKTSLELIGTGKTDWNVVLRTINSCFDDLVRAQRLPQWPARIRAIEAFGDNLIARAAAPFEQRGQSNEAYSQRVGLAFFFSQHREGYFLTVAQDRAAMELELIKVALVLDQYHTDHGAYPASLVELTPKYVSTIPRDIFSEADLHYRRNGHGYLLYSVGPNGKDDGGRTIFDSGRDATGRLEYWDDVVIRIGVDS